MLIFFPFMCLLKLLSAKYGYHIKYYFEENVECIQEQILMKCIVKEKEPIISIFRLQSSLWKE